MLKRKRIFPAIALLALAFLMISQPVLDVHAFPQRPNGGPYVPWRVIKNALYNASYYLQNLEDRNVVSYVGSAAQHLQDSSAGYLEGIDCAKSTGGGCVSGIGSLFTIPGALPLPGGGTDWVVNSLSFIMNRIGSFDGHLVAYVYQTSGGFPVGSPIEFSNTLRGNAANLGVATNTWNFTFSPAGRGNAVILPDVQYFASLEAVDYLGGSGAIALLGDRGCQCLDYYNGAWHVADVTSASVSVVGLFAQKHYTVIKEYSAFPTRFDSIYDDAMPDTVNHVTAQTRMIHETGMLRNISCSGTRQYSGNYYTPSGSPDGGAYDSFIGNVLEDQYWSGDGYDDCPTNLWTEPQISDSSFSPNGDSASTFCSGSIGVNTIQCSFNWQYQMNPVDTQRSDSLYLGNNHIVTLAPGAVGGTGAFYTQSAYQSFRYSVRHVSQMGNKFYGYVLSPSNPSLISDGQLIQSLAVDNGFGPDFYDPLFNADYGLVDGYLSDGSSSGPFHDCYVYNQLPGHSDQALTIGVDYYPYRSAVCSQMPTSLAAYLCYMTGCAPFTNPDALYLSLHARHLMNKYGAGQLATAESDINSICWDGNGICLGNGLVAYSTVRHSTYLSALVKLEELLGTTTGYTLSGESCRADKGGGTTFSCLLTQRVHDVANILWKLQLGQGSWSVDFAACGSMLPGAFEDMNGNRNLCVPNQIGGFEVGYVPGDAPFAFKNPRSGALTLAEDFYCAIILSGSGCVNMDPETPYSTPTNAESTIVSMMALLDYYKMVYDGDMNFDGKVNIIDLTMCASHFNTNTGGTGNKALSGSGYLFMCDPNDNGTNDIFGITRVALFFGADYTTIQYVGNGGFETGNLNGWTCSPNCSDATVLRVPSPVYSGSYALRLGDAVNPRTFLTASLSVSVIYGVFTMNLAFYLPILPDLNTQAAFPQLEVFLQPTFGPFVFLIQPSGLIVSGNSYDCFATGESVDPHVKPDVGCYPAFLVRGGWNVATVRSDSSRLLHFSVNGRDLPTWDTGYTDPNSFIVSIEKCTSIYFLSSGSQTCSGTTSDYYNIDDASIWQFQ